MRIYGKKNDEGQVRRKSNLYACRIEAKKKVNWDSKFKEFFENMKLSGHFCYNFEKEKIYCEGKVFYDIMCDAIFLGKKKVKTFVPKKEWNWVYPV